MSRALFIVVAAFWVIMNVLLMQTEFGSRKSGGSVPLQIVWEKILTAADDSSLTVYRDGKLVGACHLQTEVGEQWSKISDDNMPNGRPVKNRGYKLRLDGSVVVTEITNRFRFEGDLKLNKHREWQEVNARVTMRPIVWEIHSVAADRNLHLLVQGGPAPLNLTLRFSDLQNPAALTSELFGPMAGELAAEAGLAANPSSLSLGLKWDAQEDIIRIGRTPVQVYRLHTQVMDKYEMNAIISRAGEILRIDLPGKFELINDRLTATGEMPRRKTFERKTPGSPVDAPAPSHD